MPIRLMNNGWLLFRCCICSWNVNILPPNKESNLFPWLDLYSDEEPADIYAIG